jgi:DNA/RNA-binding domain of Phe-tRNA-synthetase-like protein
MKNIEIDKEFGEININVGLGAIKAKVKNAKNSKEITKELKTCEDYLKKNFDTSSIKEIENIKDTRTAYKKAGKDPSRYRSSAEALARRLVQNKRMYRINNLVDAGNLISLKTGLSLGAYDYSKINGDILFRIGKEKETYKGIGRGEFNLEGLMLFSDEESAFGNPTGDSQRTMIEDDTDELLIIIMCFGKKQNLLNSLDYAKEILTNLCEAKEIEEKTVFNF